MSPQYRCSSAILAGGTGRRMEGREKGLLPFENTTFIGRKIDILREFSDSIAIITNQPDLYRQYDARTVRDAVPWGGVLVGLYTALTESPEEYVFVTTADTPFLEPRLIGSLIQQAAESEADAVVPRHGEYIEPLCAVYRKKAAGAVSSAIRRMEKQIRSFYDDISVLYVDVPEEKSFININTVSEYDTYFFPDGRVR